MNLTTKRMLQFMTVCAGASALSASAVTTWVADSFETADGGSANLPIDQYKMSVTGTNDETTNRLWFSQSGDASKIIAGESVYGQVRPMQVASPNNDFILNLETEGTTLSRTNDTVNQSFATASVFVDTLIKFTPSEDTPTIEEGVKVAVYVNVSSNLVIYHKGFNEEVGGFVTNSVVTTVPINCDDWHRLTIEMGKPAAVGAACRIYLDGGAAIVHPNGFTEANVANGEWFKSAGSGNDLSTIAFQGTGKLDELVVADEIPGATPVGIVLTLSYDTGVADILTNGVAVGNGGTVKSDTTVTIACKDWYQVASITGATYPEYGGNLSASNQIKTATVTLSATESTNVTVTSEYYTGTAPTGFEGIDVTKLSAWAVANSLTEANVIANAAVWADDYLLNLPPATDAAIKINSITLDDGTSLATIKVGATVTTPAVDFTAINGTLVVYTTEDLATPFAEILSFDITLETASEVTITVPYGIGNFIKAVVK